MEKTMNYNITNQKLRVNEFAKQNKTPEVCTLANAEINREYIIKEIRTKDLELLDFLFTLGCYEGEVVTVISNLAANYVISVKDARYSIGEELAKVIIV